MSIDFEKIKSRLLEIQATVEKIGRQLLFAADFDRLQPEWQQIADSFTLQM